MAYPTCPWSLTPQLIADEAPEYGCSTCNTEVRFSSGAMIAAGISWTGEMIPTAAAPPW